MNDYNLEPGEFLIMQQGSVRLGTATASEKLTEIALTNRNLILVNEVSRGLLRTERMIKRCPLSALQRHQGDVQLPILKQKDHYCLQVLCASETFSILFTDGSRRTAERWASAIQQAADGNFNDIQREDFLPPELAEIIDGTKDVLSSLTGKKRGKSTKNQVKSNPVVTSARCPGCHAPLAGNAGSIAVCPYCDTKHAP